jgi:hypothetical protein
MGEFNLSIFESYTNSWIIELKNKDDKLLVWDNNSSVKDGVVTVIDRFIEKFPEYRKDALEAMFDELENSKDCSQCNYMVSVEKNDLSLTHS